MSISYAGTTHYDDSVGGSPFTFSHNVGAGSNRLLIVQAHVLKVGTNTFLGASGVTYNGVSMTRIAAAGSTRSGTDFWYLINPASGTNDVVVTYNESVGFFHGDAISFNGVHQTLAIGEFGTDSRSSETSDDLEVTLSELYFNSWVVGGSGVARTNSSVATTVDNTSIYNYTYVAVSTFRESLAASYNSSAGSTTTDTATHSFDNICQGGLVVFEIRSTDGYRRLQIEESVEVAEQVSKDRQKNFTESVEITETKAVGFIFFKNIVENLEITETIQKTFTKIIEESVKITETLVRIREKIFSEGIKLTETVSPSFKYIKSIVESIEVSTWLRNVLNGFRVGFWTKQDKTSATFTAEEKESTTWTEEGKKTATWTPQDKKLNE